MNTNNIKSAVLKKIKPTADEQVLLSNVADELINKVNSTAVGQDIPDVSAQLVGSAARGTWISGTHDLDIFSRFIDISGQTIYACQIEISHNNAIF